LLNKAPWHNLQTKPQSAVAAYSSYNSIVRPVLPHK